MWIENLRPQDVHAHRDDLGFPVLTVDFPVPTLLITAFEHDIQTESIAKRIYDILAVTGGDSNDPLVFQGNSCSVTIDQQKVRIQNDIGEDDEVVEMTTDQYRVLLDAWAAHLSA